MERIKLINYARLIARSGINVLPGQEVIIRAEPEQTEFTELLCRALYEAGAGAVTVDWRFAALTRLDIEYQSPERLGRVLKWQEQRLEYRCETLPATIYLDSDDPDGLKGIDGDKWAAAQQARYRITKPYADRMENKYQWCVAAVPGKKWAQKVFPGLEAGEAVERLWELILKCSRADGPDPMAAWEEHNKNLARRCQWLNSLKIKRLIYKSELSGTDFNVGLMPDSLFCGGAEELVGKNVMYNANIPSEEVFTTPRSGDAEGFVRSTRPLSYRGSLIENFWFRFEDGKVAELGAEKNEEALKIMVGMDEGSCRLGECALVPWRSPIRESGVLFYNTLFDENASCHLALGMGYSSCLKDYWRYSNEELRAKGVNDSMIHEDFMIGTEDLNIRALCENGEKIVIFENGHWAQD